MPYFKPALSSIKVTAAADGLGIWSLDRRCRLFSRRLADRNEPFCPLQALAGTLKKWISPR